MNFPWYTQSGTLYTYCTQQQRLEQSALEKEMYRNLTTPSSFLVLSCPVAWHGMAQVCVAMPSTWTLVFPSSASSVSVSIPTCRIASRLDRRIVSPHYTAHSSAHPSIHLSVAIYAGSRISAQLLCRNVTPICASSASMPSCCTMRLESTSPPSLSHLSPQKHPPTLPLKHLDKERKSSSYSKQSHGADDAAVVFAHERRHGAAREAGLGAGVLGGELAGGHFDWCM